MNTTSTSSSDFNRRTLAKGAAWATPVLLATAGTPTYAASQVTATSVTPYSFQVMYGRKPSGTCNASTNPSGGYIDMLPSNSPVPTETGDDGKRDPSSSNGIWLESATSGTYIMNRIVLAWTFTVDVKLVSGPNGKSYSTSGISKWSSANIVPAGWTLTQIDSKNIQAVYTGSNPSAVSTAVAGSGDAFGLFFTYELTSCPTTWSITGKAQLEYTTKNGVQTFAKTFGPNRVR